MEWLEAHWVEAFLGVVMGLMAFFGKRELDRVDKKADSKDVSAVLVALDAHVVEDKETKMTLLNELKEIRKEAKDDRHEIYSKISSNAKEHTLTILELVRELGELRGAQGK